MTPDPEKPAAPDIDSHVDDLDQSLDDGFDNDARLTGWINEKRGKPVLMGALGAFAVGLALWGVVLAIMVAGVQSAAGPTRTAGTVQEPQAPVVDCRTLEAKADRTEAEDAIFRANCAQPPVTPTAQAGQPAAPPPAPPIVQNRQDCNQIRGTQYRSDAERNWYLANCSGQTSPQTQAIGENRQNCDQIRGTQYRSDAERNWYLANCSAMQTQPTPQQPQTQPAPQQPPPVLDGVTNRQDCNQIRGTQYLSGEERDWFFTYCQ
jgi:hypothetical protein